MSLLDRPAASIPVYLVRHGCTDMNEQPGTSVDKIRGWQDVPLNEEGKQDAQNIAQKLKGKGVKSIVASDLGRAAETAQVVGATLGIKPDYTPKLRPWNLGDFQGQDTKKVIPQLKQYLDNPSKPVPGGESFQDFHDRAMEGMDDALGHPSPVAVVSHHRVERLINGWAKTGQDNPVIDETEFVKKGEEPGGIQKLDFTHYPGTSTPVGQPKPNTLFGVGSRQPIQMKKAPVGVLQEAYNHGETDGRTAAQTS